MTYRRVTASERRDREARARREREDALEKKHRALGTVAAAFASYKDAEARFQRAVVEARDAGASYRELASTTGGNMSASTLQYNARSWRIRHSSSARESGEAGS